MRTAGRTSCSAGMSATIAPPGTQWLGASMCVPECSGKLQVAPPEAVDVVLRLGVGAERHGVGPQRGALVERLREVEDPHSRASSNGRSNSVESTICVCVRVTPAWSRIRSSASSRCEVSRARTWSIALASPATV